MAKTEMISDLAAKTGITKGEARAVIDSIGAVIKADAADGGVVRIPGLGTFRLVSAKARSGTAPNGAAWEKPARAVLKFKER